MDKHNKHVKKNMSYDYESYEWIKNSYTQTKGVFICTLWNCLGSRHNKRISTTWSKGTQSFFCETSNVHLQPHIYKVLNKYAQQRASCFPTSLRPLFIFLWHLHNCPLLLVLCFNSVSGQKRPNRFFFLSCHWVKQHSVEETKKQRKQLTTKRQNTN